MALILSIDTSQERAMVALAEGPVLLASAENAQQQDHAVWIHRQIGDLLAANGKSFKDIHAISTVAGPGSYTGIRVGMATAKGLCYVLGCPLISLDSLELMAYDALQQGVGQTYLCPMIDARRMEVFTAVFDRQLNALMPPSAIILQENSFGQWLEKDSVAFFGSGSRKYKDLLKSVHASFLYLSVNPQSLVGLSAEMHARQRFSDLAYAEPNYLKAFYTTAKAK
ncbi:tRNA (adenosine(37)-N6)-threonylcarbamoyltransferase complex dimerization subunit type 1 TsaB [Flavihumibacter rivuli]|uniref:tRNA (adenosine(37)-N6)-threonylcarbamoyltransferase complex dimerization subunit type 1 TsaB n=1 Tax=Flavihumibacter rivuli TaxID=2838156 RepID=UPI001BDE633B|nr:tRNA (adenosine(37)-N6)-threonylcarbamoyltransferase complex dimerization subunit type 1 TsaB [Flavihumibacter rivuli]ULQ56183.1 tRNA (adenosine(37)-N6)-threonylcarbamoyltransferase complex dimerization subunit type 1 TsaB [Flavihumibacter rivuli]